jgi:hypothetical protein
VECARDDTANEWMEHVSGSGICNHRSFSSEARVTALVRQRPEVIVQVNYVSILSSERAPHIKKPAIVNTEKKKSGHEFQMRVRH